jgi:hypothetical protein
VREFDRTAAQYLVARCRMLERKLLQRLLAPRHAVRSWVNRGSGGAILVMIASLIWCRLISARLLRKRQRRGSAQAKNLEPEGDPNRVARRFPRFLKKVAGADNFSGCCCNCFMAPSDWSCASRPEHGCRQYSRCNMLQMLTSSPPERKGRPKGRLIRTCEFGMVRRATGGRAAWRLGHVWRCAAIPEHY